MKPTDAYAAMPPANAAAHPRAMESLLTRIAATVAAVVALGLPLGFFVSTYEMQVAALDTEAEINGRLVQSIINDAPDDWASRSAAQLRGPLARRPGTGVPEHRVVVDAGGRVVQEVRDPLQGPYITDGEDLFVRGTKVGELRMTRSLRPLLVQTGGVAAFGIALALVVFLTLRLLPIRALRRALGALEREQEEARRARDEAQKAARVKAEFLANMSHEIRTPMNAIIGLTHLALKTNLDPRQRDYLRKVESSGQHLLGIIDDILDFSKVEAGKLAVEEADFELDKVMANVANLVADKAAAKGLELIFDIAPEVPTWLRGDSLRLGQVLVNLANNAVKFTERGEVGIEVRVRERSAGGMLLHFAVHDTGIGLSTAQVAGLFQSFAQADASTTRKFGGTGLGLAISRKLALLMGGNIGVSSKPGKGSTFWFTAQVGEARAPARPAVALGTMNGRRALVVDDNDNAREVMCDMLVALGFEVREASSGEEAVEMVRQAAAVGKPFDILYLDWRMPVMDGVETARQIAGLGLASGPAVIMVTAYSREDVRREAELVGVKDVLVKPVTAALLQGATAGALATAHACDPSPGAAGEAAEPVRPTPLQGARVLLVEDNEINQIVAAAILAESEVVVDVAENGEVAVRMVQDSRYDLVLMDMQMPVMDGLAATRAIRRLPGFETLPIVAMTASAMEADRRRCMDAGMNGYVTKPIEPDELHEALATFMRPAGIQGARLG